MMAIITTEELEQLNQFMFKQLKNRYQDKSTNKRFVIGVDKPKMRLYDAEDAAQSNISDSGQADSNEPVRKPFERKSRDAFKSFKV